MFLVLNLYSVNSRFEEKEVFVVALCTWGVRGNVHIWGVLPTMGLEALGSDSFPVSS